MDADVVNKALQDDVDFYRCPICGDKPYVREMIDASMREAHLWLVSCARCGIYTTSYLYPKNSECELTYTKAKRTWNHTVKAYRYLETREKFSADDLKTFARIQSRNW